MHNKASRNVPYKTNTHNRRYKKKRPEIPSHFRSKQWIKRSVGAKYVKCCSSRIFSMKARVHDFDVIYPCSTLFRHRFSENSTWLLNVDCAEHRRSLDGNMAQILNFRRQHCNSKQTLTTMKQAAIFFWMWRIKFSTALKRQTACVFRDRKKARLTLEWPKNTKRDFVGWETAETEKLWKTFLLLKLKLSFSFSLIVAESGYRWANSNVHNVFFVIT